MFWKLAYLLNDLTIQYYHVTDGHRHLHHKSITLCSKNDAR